jgi:nonribosomal peptide synthetase DhbF
MIPAAFVVLDALPLTPSGKLDRNALPAPDQQPATEYTPPRTAREEKLCALFADTLELARVGIDDNFFDLGGHSLLAIRLGRRIRNEIRSDFPITAVYTTPVVRDLAAMLDVDGPSDRAPDLSRDIFLPSHIKLTRCSRRPTRISPATSAPRTGNLPRSVCGRPSISESFRRAGTSVVSRF